MSPTVHATAVALRLGGAWRGVLIRGAPGSGKSDLALRLMDIGGRLIGDDYVHLWTSSERLFVTAPATISGLVEVRGLGIRTVTPLKTAPISLVIDLIDHAPERMPEPKITRLCGVDLPLLQLDPRPASATTLVIRALEAL
ncbi:HPr kinase/phosphorylase [Brevundimonas sp.]|uniref:HPr kinase/phosphorylase n=1 Tax=Brevundimonas sp. TaxID=1871086 RepID=UPI002FCB3341